MAEDYGYEEPGCNDDHGDEKKQFGDSDQDDLDVSDNAYNDSLSDNSSVAYTYKSKHPQNNFYEQSTLETTYQPSRRGIHFSTKVQQFEYEPEYAKTAKLAKNERFSGNGQIITHHSKLPRNSIISKSARISIKASKPIVISLEADAHSLVKKIKTVRSCLKIIKNLKTYLLFTF